MVLNTLNAYVQLKRRLEVPEILAELGLPVQSRAIYRKLVDFMVYLNQGRFKVVELSQDHVDAFVKGKTGEYRVYINLRTGEFSCGCPHHKFRKALCKHVLLVLELYIFLTKDRSKVVEFLWKNLNYLK
ncbi:MAG: hypothetical protein DRJ40_08525 [Thermoprotei archaeon]|nr:MAG: hypothetical protein DRJ40_08525 [Thermoprotei archaeon]